MLCHWLQVPRCGLLVLTDEEKETLGAEGYPLPNPRLPLAPHEEKYLKRIRRKIKNKVTGGAKYYIVYYIV